MTLEQLRERRGEIEARMRRIHEQAGDNALSDERAREWAGLQSERDDVDDQITDGERRERAEDARRRFGRVRVGGWSTSAAHGSASRSQALAALDDAHRDGRVPDYAAERVAELVDHSPSDQARTLAARWTAAAGDPAYRSAFARLCADPTRGHLLWTPGEQEAYQRAAAVQAEMRQMGVGSPTAGGFMVPLDLDPAIMLTSDGSVNPLRRISRVVQTVSNEWAGVTSAGVTAEWKAEHAEAADATPTLDQPTIPVHLGDAFVPYSYEVGMDAMGFLDDLQGLLLDAADQLQAEAFMNGTGTGQPTGLTVGLDAASNVAAATADVIVADDVVGLQNALPPRFQPRAQWGANITTINTVGSFETTNGSLRFPEVSRGQLLRKPLNEASALDAAGDTATAGNDNVLAYGDFAAGFVIADRVGTTLEIIPNLFGANQRPTAQRGAFLWFRTGSDVVVDNAFRLLTA